MNRFPEPTQSYEDDFEAKYAGEHVNWLYEQCKYLAFPLTEKHLSAWTGEERAEQADEAHADMESALDQYLDRTGRTQKQKQRLTSGPWKSSTTSSIRKTPNTK